MSPLAKSALAAAVASFSLVAETARAEDQAPVTTTADDDPHWNASLRAGGAAVFNAGISFSGAGFGASLRRRFGSHLWIDLAGITSSGTDVRAVNASTSYRAGASSLQGTGGIGYELRLGRLALRPGVRAGVLVLSDFTSIGGVRVSGVDWHGIVGLGLEAAVRVRWLEIGVAGDAYFMPSWPAALTMGTFGVAGIAF